jgi:hypothetical protein
MPKPEELAQLVFFVRGERVIFDTDLAMLYGVRTKALNQGYSEIRAGFLRTLPSSLRKSSVLAESRTQFASIQKTSPVN